MRLIDADQLISDIQSHNDMEENNPTWRSKDVVMLLENAPEQPNDPLTLEELREMDGEPVWVVPLNDFDILPANYLVNAYAEQIVVDKFGAYLDFEDYGKTWLAYRRRPEEGTA